MSPTSKEEKAFPISKKENRVSHLQERKNVLLTPKKDNRLQKRKNVLPTSKEEKKSVPRGGTTPHPSPPFFHMLRHSSSTIYLEHVDINTYVLFFVSKIGMPWHILSFLISISYIFYTDGLSEKPGNLDFPGKLVGTEG